MEQTLRISLATKKSETGQLGVFGFRKRQRSVVQQWWDAREKEIIMEMESYLQQSEKESVKELKRLNGPLLGSNDTICNATGLLVHEQAFGESDRCSALCRTCKE